MTQLRQVLAGALQLKAKESPSSAAAAGTMLMLASITQVLCTLLAMVGIEKTCKERRGATTVAIRQAAKAALAVTFVCLRFAAELDAEELDAEVQAADEIQQKAKEKFDRVTDWAKLPPPAKFVLILDARTFIFTFAQPGTRMCF